MAEYTPHRNLPYPEGADNVAVHTDVRALAVKADSEMHLIQHEATSAATAVARDTAISTATRVAADAAEAAAPPRLPVNLVDLEDTVLGSLSSSGNVNPHHINRVTPFIPVHGGREYVSRIEHGSHRIIWFDQNQTNISDTHTEHILAATVHSWQAPEDAAYARVGISPPAGIDPMELGMIFNEGTALVDVNTPHDYPPSGYWDGREIPQLRPRSVTVDNLDFVEDGKIAEEYVAGAVPPRLTNLVNLEDTVLGSLSPTGSVYEHHINRVTPYIRVSPDQPYASRLEHGLHRIVWFDANQQNITGTHTDHIPADTTHHWVSPTDAAYARIGIVPVMGVDPMELGLVFNQGDELWDPTTPPSSGWWDDRELPPMPAGGGSIDEDTITDLVESLLPQYEPSFPTLQFETVYTGWATPRWLSEDGTILYGGQGHILLQSTDEWETTTPIHEFDGYNIQGIRVTGDGELLVSTSRDESINRRAKVWRSTGYDPDTATVTEFTEVLEALVTQANFINSWGMDVYQNIAVASEYGLRGEQGARHVYLSEDHGQTWRTVFDQMTQDVPGRPPWTETAHIHTAAWDPYWSRLWLVVGDNPNTATYYSDDKGDTWVYVEGSGGPSPAVQYTGIKALPDVVLFGSDRAPNGVHAFRRTTKADMPIIKPLLLVDDADVITKVFQLPFKRDWGPNTPTYFTGTGASGRSNSMVVGTVDGKKAHLLWESVHPDIGGEYSGDIRYAFGPTAQGNIIGVMDGDPTVTGSRIMKAPAPTWARA